MSKSPNFTECCLGLVNLHRGPEDLHSVHVNPLPPHLSRVLQQIGQMSNRCLQLPWFQACLWGPNCLLGHSWNLNLPTVTYIGNKWTFSVRVKLSSVIKTRIRSDPRSGKIMIFSSRVKDSLVRAGLLLRFGNTGLGRRREGWAAKRDNTWGVCDIKGINTTSGARKYTINNSKMCRYL